MKKQIFVQALQNYCKCFIDVYVLKKNFVSRFYQFKIWLIYGEIMNFCYECDDIDGLILIDEQYLDKIDDELLRELDIFIDCYGKSELVYDFPNENWNDVRKRETKELVEFCNSGKMVIFLHYKDEKNGEITISNSQNDSKTFINIESGKLVLVNASELIQCLSYPDLEMERILEIDNIEKGFYSIEYEEFKSLKLTKKME